MDIKALDHLRRAPARGSFGGVCPGVAYWLGVPAWTARVAMVVGTMLFFPAALAYLVAWALMPAWRELPEDFDRRVGLADPVGPVGP